MFKPSIKNLLSSIIALLVLIYSVPISSASTETTTGTTADGFEYEITNGEGTINRYIGKNSKLTIPSEIEGYPITSIDMYAFSEDPFLVEEISIPSSIATISPFTFKGCWRLTHVGVDSSNPNFYSINGVLFDKENKALIYYPDYKSDTSYTIPDGTLSIGESAFSTETAMDGWFEGNCLNLENIIIPDSVLSIGDDAFEGCINLQNLNIGKGVKSIGKGAFSSCISLTSITIPNNVTYINEDAFAYCNTLDNITIGSGVTNISSCMFLLCENLSEITLSDSIQNIDSSAFEGCFNFTDVHYGGTESQWNKVTIGEYNDSLTNATIHFTEEPEVTEPVSTPDEAETMGDVNMDGELNIKDATAVQKHLVALSVFNDEALALADFNADGTVNVKDATAIQKKIAGII